MGKKILKGFVLAILVCLVCSGLAGLKELKAETDPGVIAAQQAKETKARAMLKMKEWIVYLAPETGKGLAEEDVITFKEDGTVSSRNLLAQGFGDTNYRASVQDNGTIVWETMKAKENNDLVFLRGELSAGAMRGTYYFKPVRGKPSTYNFSTERAK